MAIIAAIASTALVAVMTREQPSSMPTAHRSRSHNRGFTLIEISIVLVIIGLVVGGVLVGVSLVENARLARVGTELAQLSVAMTTYKEKYGCLAGDCSNATSIWGTNPNCGGSQSSGTCNGDGNGVLEAWWVPIGNSHIEALWGLQQLSLAGLLGNGRYLGSYQGALGGVPAQDLTKASLVPVSSYNPNIGYYPFTGDPGIVPYSGLTYRMLIQIGAVASNNSCNDFLTGPGFDAVKAAALDRKIDDGAPMSGKVFASNPICGGSPINPNTSCVSGSAYLPGTQTGCTMYFTPEIP